MDIDQAAFILSKFARTAPGRLPSEVQDAINFVENFSESARPQREAIEKARKEWGNKSK